MRKSKAACIVARRLSMSPGRVDALVQSASDAGLLPKAIGRSYTDLVPSELATLLLAVVADRGLGVAGQSVREFSGLQAASGETLLDTLTALFSHGPSLAGAVNGALIARLEPASVSMTLAGHHRRYGPEPPPGAAGKHVVVPGQTLTAIGLEFAGHSPSDADALVALARVSASASVGLAMHPVPR